MSDLITVIPQDGRLVRDEEGKRLPDKGKAVMQSLYWRRRIADGDVRIEEPEAASQETARAPRASAKKDKS